MDDIWIPTFSDACSSSSCLYYWRSRDGRNQKYPLRTFEQRDQAMLTAAASSPRRDL